MLKIVFLDAKTLGDVPNLSILEKQGDLEVYQTTYSHELIDRTRDKDVIITNKVLIDKKVMDQLPKLKLICVSATGMNNVDLKYAKEKGIQVKNVADYSTESVAQLTFTLLLYLIHRPAYYDAYVKSGEYSKSGMFTHFGKPFRELSGKVMGIIGLGTIGNRVAQIAQSFGMEVIYYSTTGINNNSNYKRYDLDTLLSVSDVVSIHAPLTERTKNLINYEKLKLMRPCSIILNTGRGAIINENDLARALTENLISSAGIDVFENEPINSDNPLLKIKNKEKLLLTPHIAWASEEARQRLVLQLAKNIEEFRSELK